MPLQQRRCFHDIMPLFSVISSVPGRPQPQILLFDVVLDGAQPCLTRMTALLHDKHVCSENYGGTQSQPSTQNAITAYTIHNSLQIHNWQFTTVFRKWGTTAFPELVLQSTWNSWSSEWSQWSSCFLGAHRATLLLSQTMCSEKADVKCALLILLQD